MTVLVQLALTFGLLSLLSIGGANATIPEIHRQMVEVLHWMDDATFAKLIAIGQTAPGPNVLVVSMIGWHVAGVGGLLLATAAFVGPSAVFAVVVGRLMTRYEKLRGIALARRALAPIAVGLMLASGVVMTKVVFDGPLSLAIVASVAVLVYTTKTSPYWGILAGGCVGVAGHALHLLA